MEFVCNCGDRFADLGAFLDHAAERHGVAQCRRPVPRPDWREAHREHARQQRQREAVAQTMPRRWPVQELARRTGVG